jgi:hypothetical protein
MLSAQLYLEGSTYYEVPYHVTFSITSSLLDLNILLGTSPFFPYSNIIPQNEP